MYQNSLFYNELKSRFKSLSQKTESKTVHSVIKRISCNKKAFQFHLILRKNEFKMDFLLAFL